MQSDNPKVYLHIEREIKTFLFKNEEKCKLFHVSVTLRWFSELWQAKTSAIIKLYNHYDIYFIYLYWAFQSNLRCLKLINTGACSNIKEKFCEHNFLKCQVLVQALILVTAPKVLDAIIIPKANQSMILLKTWTKITSFKSLWKFVVFHFYIWDWPYDYRMRYILSWIEHENFDRYSCFDKSLFRKFLGTAYKSRNGFKGSIKTGPT